MIEAILIVFVGLLFIFATMFDDRCGPGFPFHQWIMHTDEKLLTTRKCSRCKKEEMFCNERNTFIERKVK